MNELSQYLHNEIIKYMDVHSFINFCYLNKKSQEQCKAYLCYMKGLYYYEKRKKTYKNCLYVLVSNMEKIFIKIVKVKNTQDNKKKIYFWVLSAQKTVGKRYVIWPDHSIVENIEDENLIPFY
jgi:hypothetical protein